MENVEKFLEERTFVVGEDSPLRRAPLLGILLLATGAAGSAWLAAYDPTRFFFSYLAAFFFFLTLSLGGLIFVLIQLVTRAGWSVTVRRLAEQAAALLPLFAVLFIPILLGGRHLYEWTHAEAVAQDPLLQHKASYLNLSFFNLRSVFYLLLWAGLGWWFHRQSKMMAEGDPVERLRRLQIFSAPAIVLFAVTLTFAAFDWVMSLDPHWYSTILGVYIFAGSFVSILAFLILRVQLLQYHGLLEELVTSEHFHDLGKLLFGFVVFWAYIAFSQFMLIWYAAIPEETAWYAHRLEYGWEYVTLLLAIGHFVGPFFFLLSREVKRKRLALGLAAGWLLAMHYVDIYWLILPAAPGRAFQPHLLDLTTFLAVAGVFVIGTGILTAREPLIPRRDPRLAESLRFENL